MRCSQTSLGFLFIILFFVVPTVYAEELPDSSFLEFIIEMDEVTGDGFEQWLQEDDETDQNQKSVRENHNEK